MTTETAIIQSPARDTSLAFPPDKVELLKRTICKGATDDELELFLHVSKRTGLDPFARQIHAVKRWQDGREVMTVQTGIDGYRLIAERSDRYMPGREATFEYDEAGLIVSATAYVKKLDKQGQWHEISASARFEEYCGRKKDGTPNSMWNTKPHIMLAKCAEALVLRKAFPAELSGIYTREEMDQADVEAPQASKAPASGKRQVVNEQTGEVQDEEQPDLTNDMVFMGAWHDTLKGRGWTLPEAEAALKGKLDAEKLSLQQVNLVTRRALLVKADAGKFDTFRDAIRAKAKQQQEQGGGESKSETKTEQKSEPAKEKTTQAAPVKPADAEKEVESYEQFLRLAREAAADQVEDDVFERGIGQALMRVSKKGKGETTSKPWRAAQLAAIRAGAFDWKSGAINQVANAIA